MLKGIDGLADDLGVSYQDNDIVAKLIYHIVSNGAHFGVKANTGTLQLLISRGNLGKALVVACSIRIS